MRDVSNKNVRDQDCRSPDRSSQRQSPIRPLPGGTTGVCNSNPGGFTQNGNNGDHIGFVNNCKAI